MRDINDYSNKYQNEPFEDTLVKIRKKMVIAQCNKYKHGNILEIGCGLSPFFLDFKDYNKMVIVDPSYSFIENAKKNAFSSNSKVDFINGFFENEIETINKKKIHYDFIILSSVLHEIDNPHNMLSAIKKICSDDTVVHINVPNAYSLHRLIAYEIGIIDDIHEKSSQMKKMQRQRTYDLTLLKNEVEAAGFNIIDSGSYFIKPFTHEQMQKNLDYGIINSDVIKGLNKAIKYLPEFGAEIYLNVTIHNT